MSVSHLKHSYTDEIRGASDDKAWSLISKILSVGDSARCTSLRARIAAHWLVKEMKFAPGLKNPKLQKQVWKNAISRRRLLRATMTITSPSAEEYFQRWLAPLHLLNVLSDTNLRTPRNIRIGKHWIKDDKGETKNITPENLERNDFIRWLKAETYNSISQQLTEDISCESEEIIPFDWMIRYAEFKILSDDFIPLTRKSHLDNRYRQTWFWNFNDPAVILQRLEEKGLWTWRLTPADALKQSRINLIEELVNRMKSESSPQGRKYISALEKLITEKTDPSQLADKDLSALIQISPQRIRQLRHFLKRDYHASLRTSSH